MNKKTAVALAVGAVFTTPALAQVEIYGRLYPAIASFKASGATTGAIPSNLVVGTQGDFKQRWSVDSWNSRLGFRGREALGGGLNAIWQIEQRVEVDTGANRLWANRDSFVGLASGFGTVRLGIFDTIHNDYGNIVNFFGIRSGHITSTTSLITDSGLGTGGVGFDVRKANSLKYETPEFGGFQAGLSYAPDEAEGNPGRGDLNSNLWAAAVKWSAGPLYLSAQYEQHNDHFDGSITSGLPSNATVAGAESKDRSMRVSARYQITPAHRLAGDFGRLEYKESGPLPAGRFESRKHNVWQVGWEASWGGPWRTAVSYAQATDGDCSLTGGVACSTAGLKSNQIAAAVAYDFSKRTFLYAGWARLDLGVHLVDLALWSLGFPRVEQVSSRLFAGGRPLAPGSDEVEDYATIRLDLAGGAIVRIASSWRLHAGRDAVIDALFYGTEGGACMRNIDGSFFDFIGERYRGTTRELLAEPPDDWGGGCCNMGQKIVAGPLGRQWTRRRPPGRPRSSRCQSSSRTATEEWAASRPWPIASTIAPHARP
jgi:predicted porin